MLTKSYLRGHEKGREKKSYLLYQLVIGLSILLSVGYLLTSMSRTKWSAVRYSHVGNYLSSIDFTKNIRSSLHLAAKEDEELEDELETTPTTAAAEEEVLVEEEQKEEEEEEEEEEVQQIPTIKDEDQHATPSLGDQNQLSQQQQQEEDDVQQTTTTKPPSKYIEDKYHMVVSTDNTIFSIWTVQICYQQYLKIKEQYPDSPLGGFTRLLHSNYTDSLMDVIPTIRVDELPNSELTVEGEWVTPYYPPLNRPYAFHLFTRDHLHTIPERYLFMAEPDHIIMEPPPLPSQPDRPITSSFWYMNPQALPDIVAQFNPNNVSIEHFYPTGNAPGIMDRDQLAAISENWYEFTKTLLHTPEFRNPIGWVLEMYSFVFAAATTLNKPIHFDLMDTIQTHPPREDLYINGKHANIFHYTYSAYMNATNDCTWGILGLQEDGKIHGEWEWDKRYYRSMSPPTNFLPPPSRNPSCDSMRLFTKYMNEASARSPNWLQMVDHNAPYPWIKMERERIEKGEPQPEAVRLPMNELLDLYVDHYLGFQNEFSESLESLREYAEKCRGILVVGQGSCTVLWPLMQGLHAAAGTSSTISKKHIIGSDPSFHPNVDEVKKVASGLGIEYTFHQQPSLFFDIERGTEYDMLFIDSWHVAGQLKRELEKYAANRPSLKYIAIHATTLYGTTSQSIQLGWDVKTQAEEQGMTKKEVSQGLKPVIQEFIAAHTEWVVEKEVEEGNGLTILAKK